MNESGNSRRDGCTTRVCGARLSGAATGRPSEFDATHARPVGLALSSSLCADVRQEIDTDDFN